MCNLISLLQVSCRLLFVSFVLCSLTSCTDEQDKNKTTPNSITTVTGQETNIADTAAEKQIEQASPGTKTNYAVLQKKIIYGAAKLADVKLALTEKDVGSLTNTVHGLYSMRWHRGVYNLLDDMWDLNKEKHPDLAWELLEKAPVRIALASTINRTKIVNTEEQKEYIRAHKYDDHEFHRAQVVVALGMNGEVSDIEYIKSMASGDNHYVAQSAISGLALMGGNEAKYALAEIWRNFQGTKRGELAKTLIQKVYNQTPTLDKPEQIKEE